jgi:hypothetical protein
MAAMTREAKARWAERVAAWQASGQTSVEFCAGREFTAGGLRHWAYRLRQAEAGGPKAKAPVVRLARLVRTPALASAAEVGPVPEVAGVLLQLGAVQVAVRRGFDRDTLAAVLDVLDGRGQR